MPPATHEDIGGQELSYAEVKAIASGNPAVLTLAKADAELQMGPNEQRQPQKIVRVGVQAIVLNGGAILLGRRKNTFQEGSWGLG